MAKRGRPRKGEQLKLIETGPEHSDEIIECAKRYKEYQRERMVSGKAESDEKKKLLEIVKNEQLQRLEDGVIRFNLGGFLISVEPRDEVVKVKEILDESWEDDGGDSEIAGPDFEESKPDQAETVRKKGRKKKQRTVRESMDVIVAREESSEWPA